MGKPRDIRPRPTPPVRGRGRPRVYEEERQRVLVHVPVSLRQRVVNEARRRKMSFTAYVNEILDRHTP